MTWRSGQSTAAAQGGRSELAQSGSAGKISLASCVNHVNERDGQTYRVLWLSALAERS